METRSSRDLWRLVSRAAGYFNAGYAEAPARAVAEMGCERNTCESLRQYVNASQWATRDPRFGVEASEWLEANRYIATGCREVQARIEAAGGPARYDAGTR